jgi:hypothetical protein
MQKDVDFQVNEQKALKGSSQNIVELIRLTNLKQDRITLSDMHLSSKCYELGDQKQL